MEAEFLKTDCPRCKYCRAERNVAKDGSQEHFMCLRCGYYSLTTGGKKEEHLGLGAWVVVVEKGIVASAIYLTEDFYGNIGKLQEAFKGAKIFYTRVDSIGKYLLVDSETEIKYPFEDDCEICFEGLRKITK